MASVNQTRGTPGIIFCLFTVAIFLSTVTAWEKRLRKGTVGRIEHLSGAGDHAFYAITSDEDLNEPGIVFQQEPHGVFRRASSPVRRDDAQMLRVAVEKNGRWIVYSDEYPVEKIDPAHRIYFLKSGVGEYIEFGERNHWPEFAPATK